MKNKIFLWHHFSNFKCFGHYKIINIDSREDNMANKIVDILHVRMAGWPKSNKFSMLSFKEALQGPSDLMVCFGTFHRLHNINNSINAKVVTHSKSLRSLIGDNNTFRQIKNTLFSFSLCCPVIHGKYCCLCAILLPVSRYWR